MTSPLFSFNVPAKTFMAGEYAVLVGGLSLIVTTPPNFNLSVNEDETEFFLPHDKIFHLESPAGKFLKTHKILGDYFYQFINPYEKQGGFGASTAEFLSLYHFHQTLIHEKFDAARCLSLYKNLSYSGKGIPPSGADLMAQAQASFTSINNAYQLHFVKQAETNFHPWPFETLNFCLIPTGQKIKTHTHLENLSSIDFSDFCPLAEKTAHALKQANALSFCHAIKQYANMLEEKNLVAPHSRALLQTIQTYPGVKAAKGCGALGADVLLIIVETDLLNLFKKTLEQLNLTPIFIGN